MAACRVKHLGLNHLIFNNRYSVHPGQFKQFSIKKLIYKSILKMKGFSQAIGWIIGSIIVFPLGLYCYQKYISLNDGYRYADQYIQNSENVHLLLNTTFNCDFEAYFQSYSKRQTTMAEDLVSYPFYSIEFKKYFAIQEFNAGTRFMSAMTRTKFNNPIIASVNKLEMNDPTYGTLKNPVPILRIKIDAVRDSDLNILNITDKRYKYNVGEYLTYFKSKQDFNKMFK
jgi:hypothetical protein